MVSVIIIAAVTAVIAYLIGSVNFSILLSKAAGKDIRESGSGNAGATNMLRVYGKFMGFLTLILDMVKGALVIFLTYLAIYYVLPRINFTQEPVLLGFNADYLMNALPYLAGWFAIIGHCFPIHFGFKGGKGVAAALGVVLMLDWKVGVITLAVALLAIICTRYVSVGSILGAVLFVVLTFARQFFNHEFNVFVLAITILMALLIVLRHHANIRRLKRGEENKLFARKPKKPALETTETPPTDSAGENDGDINIAE